MRQMLTFSISTNLLVLLLFALSPLPLASGIAMLVGSDTTILPAQKTELVVRLLAAKDPQLAAEVSHALTACRKVPAPRRAVGDL